MSHTLINITTTQSGDLLSILLFRLESYEIVDEFISFVNPNQDLLPEEELYIGMSSRKIKRVPQFYELAKRIIQLTENSILVGFDIDKTLRILQREFFSLGFDFSVPTIDLKTKIIELNPALESLELSGWFHYWGIPYTVQFSPKLKGMAMVQLFRVYQLHSKAFIPFDKEKKTLSLSGLQYELPYAIGLLYVYDAQQNMIYSASCSDINTFVNQAITQNEKWIEEVTYINYEVTHNKLIADLQYWKESQEKFDFQSDNLFGIYEAKNNGLSFLYAENIAQTKKKPLLVFESEAEALQYIWYLSQKFELKFSFNQKEFKTAEVKLSSVEKTQLNKKMKDCVQYLSFENEQFIVLFEGRIEGETAFVAVKNQEVIGYGCFYLNYQIRSWESINHLLIPLSPHKITFSWLYKALEHKQYDRIHIFTDSM